MIDRAKLLVDLKNQVKLAEKDLTAQISEVEGLEAKLKTEHAVAFRIKRTNDSWTMWRKERVTQAAVAWVLGTVFVRFCEDNGLLGEETAYIAGHTADQLTLAQESQTEFLAQGEGKVNPRDWLLTAFADLGAGDAGRLMFDPQHNPLYEIPLSHFAAKALIDSWRTPAAPGSDTAVVHDFCDEEWSTRFLGDLYQDLSQEAQDKYALKQTPEFIEEFILDRTLKPAIRDFGYDVVKVIDPTCGSGHFVLGAFQRILKEWEQKSPNLDRWARVRKALGAVHGVDINPFAVSIARFRLLIAAMKAANLKTLAEAVNGEWPMHLAVGDSLIKERWRADTLFGGQESADELALFKYAFEDVDDHPGILEEGRYHAVVGNPPYIAIKDAKLRELYRELYKSCTGKYVLTVPFAERFFQLAKPAGTDNKPGYVGQITGNNFMKREFGKGLIQVFLAHSVELTEVIDTSGAYIPGHGTPTVIMIGKRRSGQGRQEKVRTVRGIQGEPSAPADPAQGRVWSEIRDHIDEPGFVGGFVSIEDLDRKRYFGKHPWILAAGGLELVNEIERSATGPLGAIADSVGIVSFTLEDDLYVLPPRSAGRNRVPQDLVRTMVLGDGIRDWAGEHDSAALFPYGSDFKPIVIDHEPGLLRYMWPGRTNLANNILFGGKTKIQGGLRWYEYGRLTSSKLKTPLTITFGEVATHNHFALDRGGSVFNRTAPVIKLRAGSSEQDHLDVLGVLNSSTACFWLKQMCQDKPSNGIGRSVESEKWTARFQFNATNVQDLPLPKVLPGVLAAELDSLARQLAAVSPRAIANDSGTPLTAVRIKAAKTEWDSLRARMILLQEELDWQVYGLYNLFPEGHNASDYLAPEGSLPESGLLHGQRAFEIILARRVDAGIDTDEWIRRHRSTKTTDIPAEWPEEYRAIVERRIELINAQPKSFGLLERPEHKRRWLLATSSQPWYWEDQKHAALRDWLLDRIEQRHLWYAVDATGTEQPRTWTPSELADELANDKSFVDVAELYAPGEHLSALVPELIKQEQVPFLAALRYKPSGLAKRAVWESVWEQQRLEDAEPDELKKRKIRDAIPVPPKYVTTDFLQPWYAAYRGGLDVPKERFISYTRTLGDIEVLGWAGWDHREQAQALAMLVVDRMQNAGWSAVELTPYLAGLLELEPWVKQWHNEPLDPYPGTPATYFSSVLDQFQEQLGLTDEDLKSWVPAAKSRARAAKKTVAKKTAPADETLEGDAS
ncbi:BREX-2 system adenine-specific DNA-methyltransferase PglX [Actinospica robiniae]|uniref:BREX-2 system adenine-specific DNA-methyltransferase PglX n=1 Tax=Actinospica robiniae TaxID=304901 RepID=UPI0004074FDA|nr:BREX-2 system adenine-specific DNA-methyltransferase PglX [Actinospica robiniae]